MARRPIGKDGSDSAVIAGRVTTDVALWLEELSKTTGRSKSTLMRQALGFAREHERELLETA